MPVPTPAVAALLAVLVAHASAQVFYMDSQCPGPAQITTAAYSTLSLTAAASYGSGLDCTAVITAPVGYAVVLSFSAFATETSFDTLTLYDGASWGAAVVAVVSGAAAPTPVQSTTNQLTLRFSSDTTNVYAGFTASITGTARCHWPLIVHSPCGFGMCFVRPTRDWVGRFAY